MPAQVRPEDGGLLGQGGFVAHLRDKQMVPHIAQIGGPSAARLDALRANLDVPRVAESAEGIDGLAARTALTVGMIFSPAVAASPNAATRQMTAARPMIPAGSRSR